jgi:N-acetyl-gamma-glutamylphosphate reductase
MIDLAADLRFEDVALYERAYVAHPAKELFPHAVYGLPELTAKNWRAPLNTEQTVIDTLSEDKTPLAK